MKDVYIVAACRTATGTMGGALKNVEPKELAKAVLEELPKRAGIDKEIIEEVVFGQARMTTEASNIAKYAALAAGYSESCYGHTVMSQCSSAMVGMHSAADAIRCGHVDVVVAGGVESMSMTPFYLRGGRYGLPTGNAVMVDPITEGAFNSQPIDIYGKFGMGITAENVAKKYSITREEQDRFAYNSQMRCKAAMEKGLFKEEIVSFAIPQKKGDPIIFDTDEYPRPETSMEGLAKLKPAFDKEGCVTAGNSCGRNDGASALLLMSEDAVKKYGVKPIAKIAGQGQGALDPRYMGLGPVVASEKALKEAGIEVKDLGRVELNEAFAAQSLGCIKLLGLDENIVNVNGGAIALGHALGSSGIRIIVTLLYEMKRSNSKYGLAALCAAGGLGAATVFELC